MKKNTQSTLQNPPLSMEEEYEEEAASRVQSFPEDDGNV